MEVPIILLHYERMKAYREEEPYFDLWNTAKRIPICPEQPAATAYILGQLAEGVSVADIADSPLGDGLGLDRQRGVSELILDQVWRKVEGLSSLIPVMRAALLEAEGLAVVSGLAERDAPSAALMELLISPGIVGPLALETALTLVACRRLGSRLYDDACVWRFPDGDVPHISRRDDLPPLSELVTKLRVVAEDIMKANARVAQLPAQIREVSENLDASDAIHRDAFDIFTRANAERTASYKAMEESGVITLGDENEPLIPISIPRRIRNKLSSYAAEDVITLDSSEDSDVEEVEVELSFSKRAAVAVSPPPLAERVQPCLGMRVLAKVPSLPLPDHYVPAQVVDFAGEGQLVVELESGRNEVVPAMAVAVDAAASFALQVGHRVVAPQRSVSERALVAYVSGTVLEPMNTKNRERVLVVFDDGASAYVEQEEARLLRVPGNPRLTWRLLPAEGRLDPLRQFLKTYLLNYPSRLTLNARDGLRHKRHSVRKDGRLYNDAVVVKVDVSMALVHFPQLPMDSDREWIFTGSPRFRDVDLSLRQNNQTDPGRHRASRQHNGSLVVTEVGAPICEPVRRQTSRKSSAATAAVAMEEIGRQEEEEDDNMEKEAEPFRGTHSSKKTGVRYHDEVPAEPILRIERYRPPPKPERRGMRAGEGEELGCRLSSARSAAANPISPFLLPLFCGWRRSVVAVTVVRPPRRKSKRRRDKVVEELRVAYVAPCGRSIRGPADLSRFLGAAQSSIPVDYFSFEAALSVTQRYRESIEDLVYAANDYSNGAEETPISVVNVIRESGADKFPPPLDDYTATRFMFNLSKSDNWHIPMVCSGCSCTDDCADASRCECRQLTRESAESLCLPEPEDGFGYQSRRLEDNLTSGIYECNQHCVCSHRRCPNRVAQNALSIPFQLFRTRHKGWGVRTLVDVPRGQFLCVYAGAILSDDTAEQLGTTDGDEYFADLDLIHQIQLHKFGEEGEEDPGNRPATRLMKLSDYFGPDQGVFVIDARKFGNVGRYLNHSCAPNAFVQHHLVDTHDQRFPWVGIFAKRLLKAGEEVVWDYKYQIGSVQGREVQCHCGSSKCRGRLI